MADPSPNRGVMIVLAYMWLLALVPLLLEKEDADVQWHARHGIVLMVAEVIAFVLYFAVTSVISLANLGLGVFLMVMLVFAWIGILAIHVVAILKAFSGSRLLIPRLSEFANRL